MKKRSAVPFYTKADQRQQRTLVNLAAAFRAKGEPDMAAKADADHRAVWDARCKRASAGTHRPAAPFIANKKGFRWAEGEMIARD
jgi:hypothetical protein